MKRGWLIILLVSLGLNLGLGLKLLVPATSTSPVVPGEAGTMLRETEPEPELDGERIEAYLAHRLERLTARLGLSDAQRDALWDLHRGQGGQVLLRRQELRRARADLQELYAGGEPTLAEVQAAQGRISLLQTALDSVVVEVMHHERTILTPEQRQAYRGFFTPPRDGPRHRGEHPGRSGGQRGERRPRS